MERDNYRDNKESLVRKITEERNRFVSAWQHGADSRELNQIRQNIQELNDLLWDASTLNDRYSETPRTGRGETRDSQTRTGPSRNS